MNYFNKLKSALKPSTAAMDHFKANNLPPSIGFPQVDVALLNSPTLEDKNQYQSSGVLIRRIADSIIAWRKELPEGVQPAVLAILNGGIKIEVSGLAQESFHGIRVEGLANGVPCIMLAHQSTVQLLCYIQPVQLPETPSRKIGFVIEGEKSEA